MMEEVIHIAHLLAIALLLGSILYVYRQLVMLSKYMSAERTHQITEVKRTADELAAKTAALAAEVKADALRRENKASEHLDETAEALMEKVADVKSASVRIQRELEVHPTKEEAATTTREQIDEIKDSTDEIKDALSDDKPR